MVYTKIFQRFKGWYITIWTPYSLDMVVLWAPYSLDMIVLWTPYWMNEWMNEILYSACIQPAAVQSAEHRE